MSVSEPATMKTEGHCKHLYIFAIVIAVVVVFAIACYLQRIESVVKLSGYPIKRYVAYKSCPELYRITKPNLTNRSEVILLVHGFLGSYNDWIVSGHEKSLAYILTDRGYDVWMLEFSGCHNRRWDEMGIQNYPAIFDYIANVTTVDNFTFIGHGASNTALFALLSDSPEYNKYINCVISIAPIVFLGNSSNELLRKIEELNKISDLSVNDKQDGIAKLISTQTQTRCTNAYFANEICLNPAFGFYDYHPLQLDGELVNNASRYIPKDINYCIEQLQHYSQSVQTGQFAKYNYGKNENLQRYGVEYAPQYDMWNILVPVNVVYSRNDSLTNEQDVNELCRNVENCYVHDIGDKYVGLDHKYGKDAPGVINDKVIRILDNLTK